MSRYVDLSEKVTATYYDEQYEEWTQKTVTIADVLDSVCDDYTVVPSAQPERNDPIILRCKRILKQDELQKLRDMLKKQSDNVMLIPEAMEVVYPVRIKGRWLRYGEDGNPNETDTVFWQCDQCLESYTGRAKKIPNFCPNCGADMRGGEPDE